MRSNLLKRVLALVLLAFSLFFLPWWLSSLLGLSFMLLFRNPYEGLVLGFFLDNLYNLPNQSFVLSHIFFISAAVWFFIALELKEYLVFKL